MSGIKEGKIRISSGEIDYIAFGRGERPLVMLQGLNTGVFRGTSIPLALSYRIFTKDFRVYLFDRRPVVTDKTTVRELAQDVAEAMDNMGIKNASVLGVSQGGMIAQYLAIDRPDLVEKLVLAVTLARNNETVISVINNWISLTEKEDYKTLVSDMAEKMYSEKYMRMYRPMLPLLTLLQKPKDKERFINLTRACLTCTSYDELDKITCKTLVIGGGEDKIVGKKASEEIRRKLNCEAHIYEGLGHAAYEEAKDFNERVLRFFLG